jgi:hypothetical protein
MKAQRYFALITLPRRIGRCNAGDGAGGRVAGAVRTAGLYARGAELHSVSTWQSARFCSVGARAVSQRPKRTPESPDDIAAGRAPAGPV